MIEAAKHIFGDRAAMGDPEGARADAEKVKRPTVRAAAIEAAEAAEAAERRKAR